MKVTDITRTMIIALADIISEPVRLDDESRWINALTRRALERRGLVELRMGDDLVNVICPTRCAHMVVSAYLLGAETARVTS